MNLKVLLPVLVFAAIVIVGIGFSSRKAPPGPLPALETVTELAGIKLGELPADTATAMGPPNGMTEPVIDHGLTRFDYVYSNLKLEVVFVGADKDSARAEIICTSAPWVKLLGFDIAANEKAVFERLGNPDEVSTSNDGLVRIDSFKKWKAAFVFKHGVLSQLCATNSGTVSYNDNLPKLGIAKKGSRHATPQTASANDVSEQPANENSATPNAVETAATQDSGPGPEICAANLSKDERLGRLAAYGAVKQSGEETYDAGSHRIQFVLGGLVDCY